MKICPAFLFRILLIFPVMALSAADAFAVLDDFSPYAYARVVHDDNIFRDDVDEEDETVGHLGVGASADFKLSRQHLLFEGLVDRAEYNDFDELDHTSVDGIATWAWQVGNLWSGDLGYNYNREMASFDQQLIREKDMRKTHTGFFEAGYQLHPDWRLAGAFNYDDVSYEDRNRLDRDTTGAQFDVQYRNTLNTRVGARIRHEKYDLKEIDVLGVPVDNDYDETIVSALFFWEASGKSSLEASLGYTDLSYDELDDRDFEGFSGRVTYNWLITGKTKTTIQAWQETSSLDDEIASYVLTTGTSISPTWSVTPKISLDGEISYEKEEFKGNNEISTQIGLQRRDDDTWRYRITARWDPRRYLRLSLGYKYQDRDSSIDARDYDNNQLDAKVRFNF